MTDRGAGSFGVVQDRYVLQEIVGSGGMGVVYRATDRVLGRTVAVKMIRQELAGEEFIRRFEREAAILARIRSPYIVVVYDYGEHDDKFYMVTDFLTEGDLAGWLEHNGQMPVREAVPLVAKLAEGLADAHDLGVLHRDIKPANTLLWTRGGKLHPVLADFGIAVTSDLTLTKTGAVVGSPLYMAPERHVGEPATVASDIYSMGCLLYALVTGAPPYWGTEFQAANAHLNSPIPTVPADLPFGSEVDEVIAACMAKNPADRIASADDLAEQLRVLAGEMSPPKTAAVRQAADVAVPLVGKKPAAGATTVLSPTYPPPPPDQAPPGPSPTPSSSDPPGSGRSRGLVALVAVVAVVALVSVGGWLLTRDDDDPETERSGTPTGPTSDASDEDGAPPKAPGQLRVKPVSGYREVTFEAKVPAPRGRVGYEVERNDGGWSTARATIPVETEQGGQERCVELRLVAVNEFGRTPGPANEHCGSAEPRDIRVNRNTSTCAYSDSTPCTYWDIVLVGFRATTVVPTEYVPHAPGFGDPDPKVKQIPIDEDGFGVLGAHNEPGGERYDGGVKLDPRSTSITITADGVTKTIEFATVD